MRLIDEARLTASLYLEGGVPQQVRGGPWCRCGLPWSDREEIANVNRCTSRQAVLALAARNPSGALALHLAGESYSKAKLVVGRAAASALAISAFHGSSLAHPPKVIASQPPLFVHQIDNLARARPQAAMANVDIRSGCSINILQPPKIQDPQVGDDTQNQHEPSSEKL